MQTNATKMLARLFLTWSSILALSIIVAAFDGGNPPWWIYASVVISLVAGMLFWRLSIQG